MHLRALYLRNFRLYEEARFEFSPGATLIYGPNGQGKTSLLEAIYFLITGRSFRTNQTSELLCHGAAFFYLEADFVKHGIDQKLRVYYSAKERKVTHNSTPSASLLSLLGLLQGVILYPDDASLVKGIPAIRRRLLDLQLAQNDPLYIHHLTRYDRAMRQRNHLLRTNTLATIKSWEHEMANSAAYVVSQRFHAVEGLNVEGNKLYTHLSSGKEEFKLLYKAYGANGCCLDNNDRLRHIYYTHYQNHRPREMQLGATLTGPHKDDIAIFLNNKEARAYASEGQQRSCAAALRLAEWERLKKISQEVPLMLVDDVGTSLDHARSSQLSEHLAGLGQVFLTSTAKPLRIGDHQLEINYLLL